MTLYGIILTLHIIAAVCGLGATFALPAVMKLPKTVTQAKFALAINEKVEKIAKPASIALLVTALLLGALNPSLFKTGWYIASMVIYIAVQPLVASILPKKAKLQEELLEKATSEELPKEFNEIGKQAAPYNMVTHIAVVVLIILMTLKPF
ncbi:DUF2269 family protein [Ferdinandcohnia sp. Marseille-Q9671]